jgi:parallel beta-helix repeat protein
MGRNMTQKMVLKKVFAIGIIFLFIGITIIPLSGQAIEKSSLPVSRSHWLYVGGSGPGNYSKIQEAIDAANDGDTVYVFPGFYGENVVVNKSITLMGADKNTTIVDANHSGSCITLDHQHTRMSGFTVQHSGNATKNEYQDSGFLLPFGSYSPHNSEISDNIIKENFDGIFLWEAHNYTISRNLIQDNTNCGVYIFAGGDSNTIDHNIILNNGAQGIRIDGDTSNYLNKVVSNFLDNNTNNGVIMSGYICNVTSNHISYSKTGVIVIGPYSQVRGNTIVANGLGLSIDQSMQGVVEANSFSNNTNDATFSYYLIFRLMLPFISWPQITKWRANYWDKHLSGPKLIIGRMTLGGILQGYFPRFGFPWPNFDFTPVQSPYPDVSGGGV